MTLTFIVSLFAMMFHASTIMTPVLAAISPSLAPDNFPRDFSEFGHVSARVDPSLLIHSRIRTPKCSGIITSFDENTNLYNLSCVGDDGQNITFHPEKEMIYAVLNGPYKDVDIHWANSIDNTNDVWERNTTNVGESYTTNVGGGTVIMDNKDVGDILTFNAKTGMHQVKFKNRLGVVEWLDLTKAKHIRQIKNVSLNPYRCRSIRPTFDSSIVSAHVKTSWFHGKILSYDPKSKKHNIRDFDSGETVSYNLTQIQMDIQRIWMVSKTLDIISYDSPAIYTSFATNPIYKGKPIYPGPPLYFPRDFRHTSFDTSLFFGARIRIGWNDGKMYDGTIGGFDRDSGKHPVHYDDGDLIFHDLKALGKRLKKIWSADNVFWNQKVWIIKRTKKSSLGFIGARIEMRWKDAKFHGGKIVSQDTKSGRYKIVWDDIDTPTLWNSSNDDRPYRILGTDTVHHLNMSEGTDFVHHANALVGARVKLFSDYYQATVISNNFSTGYFRLLFDDGRVLKNKLLKKDIQNIWFQDSLLIEGVLEKGGEFLNGAFITVSENGYHFDGVIQSYDPKTKRHAILYDGNMPVEWEKLSSIIPRIIQVSRVQSINSTMKYITKVKKETFWVPFDEAVTRRLLLESGLLEGESEVLVGARVRYTWGKKMFYDGTIRSYDASSGLHHVYFDDGETYNVNLKIMGELLKKKGVLKIWEGKGAKKEGVTQSKKFLPLLVDIRKDVANEQGLKINKISEHMNVPVMDARTYALELALSGDKPRVLIGLRIAMKRGDGKIHEGTITAYNTQSAKHQIMYDSGEVRDYILMNCISRIKRVSDSPLRVNAKEREKFAPYALIGSTIAICPGGLKCLYGTIIDYSASSGEHVIHLDSAGQINHKDSQLILSSIPFKTYVKETQVGKLNLRKFAYYHIISRHHPRESMHWGNKLIGAMLNENPYMLVGVRVAVRYTDDEGQFWPGKGMKWFWGTILSYNESTQMHLINYSPANVAIRKLNLKKVASNNMRFYDAPYRLNSSIRKKFIVRAEVTISPLANVLSEATSQQSQQSSTIPRQHHSGESKTSSRNPLSLEMSESAATIIQGLRRGNNGRKKYKNAKAKERSVHNKAKNERAAVIIQKRIRGNDGRKKYQEKFNDKNTLLANSNAAAVESLKKIQDQFQATLGARQEILASGVANNGPTAAQNGNVSSKNIMNTALIYDPMSLLFSRVSSNDWRNRDIPSYLDHGCTGKIVAFDALTGKHEVEHDNGKSKKYNLKNLNSIDMSLIHGLGIDSLQWTPSILRIVLENDPYVLIGAGVMVLFSNEKDSYWSGDVKGYNKYSQRHIVEFKKFKGDASSIGLPDETIQTSETKLDEIEFLNPSGLARVLSHIVDDSSRPGYNERVAILQRAKELDQNPQPFISMKQRETQIQDASIFPSLIEFHDEHLALVASSANNINTDAISNYYSNNLQFLVRAVQLNEDVHQLIPANKYKYKYDHRVALAHIIAHGNMDTVERSIRDRLKVLMLYSIGLTADELKVRAREVLGKLNLKMKRDKDDKNTAILSVNRAFYRHNGGQPIYANNILRDINSYLIPANKPLFLMPSVKDDCHYTIKEKPKAIAWFAYLKTNYDTMMHHYDKGNSLLHISPSLRNDEEVVMKALELDPQAFQHASEKIRFHTNHFKKTQVNDPSPVVLRALAPAKVDLNPKHSIRDAFLKRTITTTNSRGETVTKNMFENDREMLLAVVGDFPSAIKLASFQLQSEPKFVMECIVRNFRTFEHILHAFKHDEDFVRVAYESNKEILPFIPRTISMAFSVPMCRACKHRHFPGQKCPICGHNGKHKTYRADI